MGQISSGWYSYSRSGDDLLWRCKTEKGVNVATPVRYLSSLEYGNIASKKTPLPSFKAGKAFISTAVSAFLGMLGTVSRMISFLAVDNPKSFLEPRIG